MVNHHGPWSVVDEILRDLSGMVGGGRGGEGYL